MNFISAKFVMGYLFMKHYILFYIHGPVILHFFFELHQYHKITQMQNGRLTTIVKLFDPKN